MPFVLTCRQRESPDRSACTHHPMQTANTCMFSTTTLQHNSFFDLSLTLFFTWAFFLPYHNSSTALHLYLYFSQHVVDCSGSNSEQNDWIGLLNVFYPFTVLLKGNHKQEVCVNKCAGPKSHKDILWGKLSYFWKDLTSAEPWELPSLWYMFEKEEYLTFLGPGVHQRRLK